MRRIGWGAGVVLVLLFGFFAFRKHRAPPDAGSAPAGSTSNSLNIQPSLGDAAAEPPLAGGTNGAGSAPSRQAENQAVRLGDRGGRLLDAGDAKGAIPFFEKAVALAPKNESLHFNLAIAFVGAGDLTNAELEYKEALHLLPDYPEAQHNYGNLLLRLSRPSEAEEHLAEAVKEMPESARYRNSLGVLWQREGKTNEALVCFRKAIECDSNSWEAHFNLALAYLFQKNRDGAIAELHETLRIKPGYEPAERFLARTLGQASPNAPSPK
jgi:tetratricopeptide (TPR) repeat protein